ncbi:MAG: hypothetical protein Q8P39_00175 [Candidatus Yanofskybacteria bacterium]|nr:hypothetical protein [Candidatus Yanofskybacteria bacterium]
MPESAVDLFKRAALATEQEIQEVKGQEDQLRAKVHNLILGAMEAVRPFIMKGHIQDLGFSNLTLSPTRGLRRNNHGASQKDILRSMGIQGHLTLLKVLLQLFKGYVEVSREKVTARRAETERVKNQIDEFARELERLAN